VGFDRCHSTLEHATTTNRTSQTDIALGPVTPLPPVTPPIRPGSVFAPIPRRTINRNPFTHPNSSRDVSDENRARHRSTDTASATTYGGNFSAIASSLNSKRHIMAVGQVSGHSGTGMGVFSKNCAFLLSFLTPFSHKLSAGQVQKLHQNSHDIINTMGDLGLKFQPHRKFLDSTYWPKTSKNGLAGAPNGTGFAHFAPILTHISPNTLKLAGIYDITSLPTQKSRIATWPPAIWLKNASFGLLGWNGTLNAAIFNVFTASGFSTPIGFWGGVLNSIMKLDSVAETIWVDISAVLYTHSKTLEMAFSSRFPRFFTAWWPKSVGTSLVQLRHMPPLPMPP
jgi:hypothetical protein